MLVHDLAAKHLRISGREYNQSRTVTCEQTENILVVRSGSKPSDSCVYIAFSKKKEQPYPDKPTEGIFHLSFEKGKRNDLLMNVLYNVYIKSRCISPSDLCISSGEEVWSVSIEIIPLQANGDLLKLCVIGINRILEALEIRMYFTPSVYPFVSLSGKLIYDPDERELEESDWRVLIVMRSRRELLIVEKNGKGVNASDIFEVIENTIQLANYS
ncbi:Rrp42p [Glugoides intestinalis]